MHIELYAGEASSGKAVLEPVHAESCGANRYRILYSPGLVYGVAAGDEISLGEDGQFEVLLRGHNLAVRVLGPHTIEQGQVDRLELDVRAIGGTLDGRINKGLSFTIPLSAGFAAIEQIFGQFVANASGMVWEYGNVYGESGQSLDWWKGVA